MSELINRLAGSIPTNNRVECIWVQAKVNFLKRYYGSFIGVIWAFINPMIQFLIYYIVFGVIINSPDENRAVSLMLGLILWSFVIESAQQGMNLLFQKRYIIENLVYNKIDMYISSVLSVLFSLVINFLIFCVFGWFFGVTLTWNVLWFPVLFVNLLIIAVGLQLAFSVLFPIIRDVTHVWDKTKLALFWLSGVVYPLYIVESPIKEILLWGNPFAGIFMNIKNIMVYHRPIEWTFFVYDFVWGIMFLFIVLQINKKYYHAAVERL